MNSLSSSDKQQNANLENFTLTINNHRIKCRFTDGSAKGEVLQVGVDNLNNRTEILDKIRTELINKFWFLGEEYENETLLERYEIYLGENNVVEIYNFNAPLNDSELSKIKNTLALYYNRLKDKSYWNLQSIQIRSKNAKNNKSGNYYYGAEYLRQLRFELFPNTFSSGKYRDCMNTSWLEGSIVHETTHIVLEKALVDYWSKYYKELGWIDVNNIVIQLPGGDTKDYYNKDYRRLPSKYASYQLDDDRAETVVAGLYSPERLNELRKKIFSIFFSEKTDNYVAQVIKKDPIFPELEINLKIEKEEIIFEPDDELLIFDETLHKPKIIPLEEMRLKLQENFANNPEEF